MRGKRRRTTVSAHGTWWAAAAHLPDGLATDVTFAIADGRFTAVRPGTAPGDARRLPGVALPGFANAHSHAFHRALRGRTHSGGGTFWTWREAMYAVAARLDPDSYRALATAAYAEMALAGVTAVAEFHYLHHGPGGIPYADPNAMRAALRAAAADAGIRITVLDTCYLAGGFDTPLEGPQLRFGDRDVHAWAERAVGADGVAVHSVRAVPREAIAVVAKAAEGRPLHVHLSEQPAENAACLARHGLTPTGLLAAEGVLGAATTAVHATHLTAADIALLGGSGTGACLCPTTERDLADGIGPARALHDAGVAAVAGQRPARRRRPDRGGQGAGDARAARDGRARPVPPDRAHGRADQPRPARPPRRGQAGGRRARRPGGRAARHRAHRGHRSRPGAVRRDRGRRRHGAGRRRAGRHRGRAPPRRRGRAAGVARSRPSGDRHAGHRDRRAHHQRPGAGHASPGRPSSWPTGASSGWAPTGRRRRPTSASTSRAVLWCPASSTATPTSCSPATARPSSPPAWRVSATTAAASRPRSRPPAPRPTTTCAPRWPPGSPRCAHRARRPSRSRAATA